jgi:2-ketocyclohexanecarboxyl-CoA hydrolase
MGDTVNVEELQDIRLEIEDGLAWIVINRPERFNSLRGRSWDELIWAFKTVWGDPQVGVVALTGAGSKSFCAGGDLKQLQETGDYGPMQYGFLEAEYLFRVIREIPKPVIAAVNGFAIGYGNVLQLMCDLTIAADTARFGQTGPSVGSWDAGWGTAYLARVLGEKRARELWMLCRQYDAATMERWGLVNQVVPFDELRSEVRRWADEILAKSPTALRFVKHSFNAASDGLAGITTLSFDGLGLFMGSEEAQEGSRAFAEKRPPDFGRFR